MKYKAPDGNIIASSNTPVLYTCICSGIANGIYESIETFGSTNEIGIEQIKIIRSVTDNVMTITITEATELELIEYKESLIYN